MSVATLHHDSNMSTKQHHHDLHTKSYCRQNQLCMPSFITLHAIPMLCWHTYKSIHFSWCGWHLHCIWSFIRTATCQVLTITWIIMAPFHTIINQQILWRNWTTHASHTTKGSWEDGRRSISQGEGVSELTHWITVHGVLHLPEHSNRSYSALKKLCTIVHNPWAFTLTYFTSMVCVFLGLLVAFWWLVFGENIFVLHKKYYIVYMYSFKFLSIVPWCLSVAWWLHFGFKREWLIERRRVWLGQSACIQQYYTYLNHYCLYWSPLGQRSGHGNNREVAALKMYKVS